MRKLELSTTTTITIIIIRILSRKAPIGALKVVASAALPWPGQEIATARVTMPRHGSQGHGSTADRLRYHGPEIRAVAS